MTAGRTCVCINGSWDKAFF